MILDFSQNGINIIFEISEQNIVALKEFLTNHANKNLK